MMNSVVTRGFAGSCASAGSVMSWGCLAPPRCATWRPHCPRTKGVDGDRKPPWQSVTQWRQSLSPMVWTRLTVRDGEKGPVVIEMVTRRVQTRIERKRTGPDEWLGVTRRPLADDGTLESRASRDATEQDARYRYQYYLTPTAGSTIAFKEPSLGELAR